MTPPETNEPDDALHQAARKVAKTKVEADVESGAGRVAAAKKVADAKAEADETSSEGRVTAALKVADAKSEADAQLIDALNEFVESRVAIEDVVDLMRKQQEKDREDAKNRRKWTWIAAGVAFIVLLIVIVGGSLIAVTQSRSNHKAISKTNQVLQRFDDCTTPDTETQKHDCYDKSQAQTAAAVATLTQTEIKASAYAVECVLAGRVDVEQCVEERFAGAPRPPVAKSSSSSSRTRVNGVALGRGSMPGQTIIVEQPAPAPQQPTPAPVDPCTVELPVFCVRVPN